MIKKILFGLIVTVSFLCSNEARDIVKRVLDRDDGKTLKQDMTMGFNRLRGGNQRVRPI